MSYINTIFKIINQKWKTTKKNNSFMLGKVLEIFQESCKMMKTQKHPKFDNKISAKLKPISYFAPNIINI